MKHVPLSRILFDSATQVRVEIDPDTLHDYVAALRAGESFPPVDLFELEDGTFMIADGWHRCLGYQEMGSVTIPAEVHPGGREAAIRFALKANSRHGLKRSNADKRKAVEMALKLEPNAADRVIGEMCAVDHKTVAAVRANWGNSPVEEKRVGSDGKARRMPAKPAAAATTSTSVHTLSPDNPLLKLPIGSKEWIAECTRQVDAEFAAMSPEQFEAWKKAPCTLFDDVVLPGETPTQPAGAVLSVEVRQPILKPSEAGGKFDSAAWKLRARQVMQAWIEEVPAKHKAAAAEFLANQARELATT